MTLTDGSLATLANMRHNLLINGVKVEGAEQVDCRQESLHHSTRVWTLGCMQSPDFPFFSLISLTLQKSMSTIVLKILMLACSSTLQVYKKGS